MRRIAIHTLCATACALLMATSAWAQVQPAGTGEPAYTNSTQNTQWLEWPASPTVDAYRIRFDYYENNVLKPSNPTVDAPKTGGTTWANWSGVAPLQHGGQYGICAQGQYRFPNDAIFFPDGPNSCSMGTMLGRRSHTTIDRSKPTAGLQLAAGAAFVKDVKVPVRVDFSDDVAGPFPANFLCFKAGAGPCDTTAGDIYGYNASCSLPGSGGKSTTFSCTADYGQVPDGTVWACVTAADASIPDNPHNSDQTASAARANLSNPSCDSVVIDRTPPAVAIAAATSVKVGDLVSFQASAADAGSGLAGAATWTWGDNTAGASGDAVTHTFTQAGTYEVALTVADAAGNAARAKMTVTVTSRGTVPPHGGGTPDGGGGTHDDGGTPDHGDGGEAPSLELDAPRKARARAKSIPVELTASDSGRVRLTLGRGRRVVARAGVSLDPDGTADYRLKLPKRTRAGRYTLKATYQAGGRTITASRRITLTGKTSARRAIASSRRAVVLGRAAPRALPDGRFHGPRPARIFKVR
jgi:PKD repeat protein